MPSLRNLNAHGLCVLALLLCQACVSAYAPPGPVVPLFDEKGDLSVGANVRPFLPTRGANLYVASAPTTATRLIVSGSMTHFDGKRMLDAADRSLREKNYTLQIEAAAGWGIVRRHRIFELFVGAGYGTSRANACRRYPWEDEAGAECGLWVTSRSSFVRPFVQTQIGGRWSLGTIAGGLRISALRYSYEMLMDGPSKRSATVATLEPFVSGSYGFPWGKLELSLMLPIVPASPDVRYTYTPDGPGSNAERSFRADLIDSAAPRFTLGIRADLDELWRDRR